MITSPGHDGLFWAKTREYKWFNVIVAVHGEAPFLTATFFDSIELTPMRDKDLSDIEEWGPEIIRPESK